MREMITETELIRELREIKRLVAKRVTELRKAQDDVARLTEALREIATGGKYLGPTALKCKNIARRALNMPEV